MSDDATSILTEVESARMDSALKGLGVTGSLRASRRATCRREIETIVREACAREMEKLSAADPLHGAAWSICQLGAKRIRKHAQKAT